MEEVVLVDEENKELGTAAKDSVHTTKTPLHRGFSCFLFNAKNELLLTKRASTKRTFPGVWTNTVCGHPGPGEGAVEAALRRLNTELGLEEREIGRIKEVAPYRYRFADKNGVVENEICPILVGYCDTDPRPDKTEVDEWKWMRWEEVLRDIKQRSFVYSPWCVEEVNVLENGKLLNESRRR